MKKKLKISIAIPTYEAGESLVVTLRSIYNQTFYSEIDKIYVAIDGNKIKSKIMNKIKNPKLSLLHYKRREGQAQRINNLFKKSSSDILVLTNDDIYLTNTLVEEIVRTYNGDLILGNVLGIKPQTFIERLVLVGANINKRVAESWNSGDNYLSCNGRLIILSKKLYKRIELPKTIWNSDAYIYFYAKKLKSEVNIGKELKAYFRAPSNLEEHIKQSDKFQMSREENMSYFKEDISKQYDIPKALKFKSLILEFLLNPVITFCYVLIYIYTRTHRKYYNIQHKDFWETDKTTKQLKIS